MTTYNEEVRSDMYNKVIQWWLQNTTFHMFIIDSANRQFSPDIENNARVKTFHFDQTQFISGTFHSNIRPTKFEMLSLNKGYEHFEKDLSKYEFVFKITGKYQIPEFEETISKIVPNDLELICQSKFPGTELLGIRVAILKQFLYDLNSFQENMILELRVEALCKNLKCFKMKPLKLSSSYARNDRSILSIL